MNYKLKTFEKGERATDVKSAIKSLSPFLLDEKKPLLISLIAGVLNSVTSLLSPFIIAYIVDNYISTKNFKGLIVYSMILLLIYVLGIIGLYIQTKVMGGVGRRVLFKLRNKLFIKLQELPIAFFNANQTGDLISRINNDTDKLNQFFSQALLQFFGNIFLIIGIGIFIVVLNVRLGVASLLPAILVLVITQFLSPWINQRSRLSLQSLGGMSAQIQESLANFKVVVAFNRMDYFKSKFTEANIKNYEASTRAGISSNILTPIYGIAANLAQIIVLTYGILLISEGKLTAGLLIGFIIYINSFYAPLRQIASIWSSFQLALASIDRISEVLSLESSIKIIKSERKIDSEGVLVFDHVYFSYSNEKEILSDVNFTLLKGRTYAMVGPTGGGKTTTASLMSRLYDPIMGTIYLDGKDIRSFSNSEKSKKIGFIIQEPFLFSGTIGENIIYGNDEYNGLTNKELLQVLKEFELDDLISRFEDGLDTKVKNNSISLGQKQLVAFIRAVLRKPELLILDEATANVDTVTEKLLESVLQRLPRETTKVIIAHRLNTIENADDIFFVNSPRIIHAGSFDNALKMLLSGKRAS